MANAPTPQYPLRHHTPIQMRFGDIDVFGHVNNTVYLQYADLAKLLYINQVLGSLFDPLRQAMVIASLNCEYYHPTVYGEPVEVLTSVISIGTHSMTLSQRVVNTDTNEVKCVCTTVMVGYDVVAASSMEIPDHWRRLISEYEGRDL